MERSADWMEQAERDLAQARHSVEGGFFEWACFASQQASEKALKAVFQKKGGEAWGHSTADLLEILSRMSEGAEAFVDSALELDKAYIAARYPDAHPSGAPGRRYTNTEANRLIDHAEGIIRYCKRLLSEL